MDKRFTEGICGDGAAILDNGKQITITEILNNLNRLDKLEQLRIGSVVGRSEQLKAFANWLQSDTANLNYDFRDLVDEYLKSL